MPQVNIRMQQTAALFGRNSNGQTVKSGVCIVLCFPELVTAENWCPEGNTKFIKQIKINQSSRTIYIRESGIDLQQHNVKPTAILWHVIQTHSRVDLF